MGKNYIIAGSGVAAVTAAKAIRDRDEAGKIMIFGREKFLPYNRINLSKELFSDLESEKNLIKKDKWFKKNNIIVFPDTRITSINTAARLVLTANGDQYAYDKLLICTGSKNRQFTIEGAGRRGAFTIREMQEAIECKAYFESRNHVLTIGGGVQGLETAWSFLQAGKKVTIVEAFSRLMGRQLDERTSLLLQNKIEKMGIKVYLNAAIECFSGKDEIEEAVINGNEVISCDGIFYSIGVIPNIELIEGTPVKTNRGIIVDEEMKTNVEDIYAAGDIAEFNGEVAGLWSTAMEQGRIAGTNMASEANEKTKYRKTLPVTIFNAFNLELFSIGQVDEKLCDLTITEDDGNEKYTRVFIKDKRIIGVISLEGVIESLPYQQAIEDRILLEGIELDKISISELADELKQRQVVLS